MTREDKLRYDSWAWLVLEGEGGTGEAFGGRRYRGVFVLHCVRVLAGVTEWKVFMAVSWVGITTLVPDLTICTYLAYLRRYLKVLGR